MTKPPPVTALTPAKDHAPTKSHASMRELITDLAHVQVVDTLHRKLSHAAIAWVIADRLANKKADDLAEIEAVVTAAVAAKVASIDGPPEPLDVYRHRMDALSQRELAVVDYRCACEREQHHDEAWREIARKLVAELEAHGGAL